VQGLILWAQSSERQMDTLAANSERADRKDEVA